MKIQCAVCEKEEASIFCTADEAALCHRCDKRVHHANKLASKHLRFSLFSPSSTAHSPLCDICQERRGFVFCQEDRAILCRECDIPIHKVNEHTQKHNRFLLCGIKLLASSSAYETSSSSNASNHSTETYNKSSLSNSNSSEKTLQYSTTPNYEFDAHHHQNISHEGGSASTSTISEYLIETLPGWHVDDFLDLSSSSPYGFSKANSNMWPFDNIESNMQSASSENMSIWVPQPSNQLRNHQLQHIGNTNAQKTKGFEEVNSAMKGNMSIKQWSSEDGFNVPDFSYPQSTKRSRQ